ncbi:CHAD domain-containing protein [Xylophilus sp. Kf1]|nr:CHAD domain-containing protein [Xylophilus sp. Kf1]
MPRPGGASIRCRRFRSTTGTASRSSPAGPFPSPLPPTPNCMEKEFKLQLPPGAATAVEQTFGARAATRLRLRARYFDTRDAVLRANGLTLRLRQEGSRWVQAAKYAGRSALVREEHEVDLGGAELPAPPSPDISLHDGTAVGKRLQRALGGHADALAELVEMFATDIDRLVQVVEVGSSTVELALDRGEVSVGSGPDGRGIAVEELELELKSGQIADLALLARQWCADLGLWVSTDTKAAKGWRLAGAGRPPLPHARTADLTPGGKVTGAALLRTLVSQCLAELLPHAGLVAAGQGDEESVHQLRVGLRRLRTVLRELGELADGVDPAWEPALAETFGTLGQWRDRSNVEDTLVPELVRHGGPDIPSSAVADTGQDPAAAVRQADFQHALIGLMAFAAEDPGAHAGRGARRTRERVRRKVERLHHKLRAAADDFESLEQAEQHRVRKRLKRLRYLVEFVGPMFDQRRARAFIQRIKPAQDALGIQNDEAVALEALQALTTQRAQAWFGVGWYTARRGSLVRASRKALVKAVARKPW